jgi:hypothetical protein
MTTFYKFREFCTIEKNNRERLQTFKLKKMEILMSLLFAAGLLIFQRTKNPQRRSGK